MLRQGKRENGGMEGWRESKEQKVNFKTKDENLFINRKEKGMKMRRGPSFFSFLFSFLLVNVHFRSYTHRT